MDNFAYTQEYYISSESEDEFDAEEPKAKRRKCNNRTWTEREEYPSATEAEAAVDTSLWKIMSSSTTANGHRVEYRCSKGAYRSQECPAGLYLLYHASRSTVSLFRTDCDHANHMTIERRRGLSDELKAFIKEKFSEGIQKPNATLALFRKKQIAELRKSQLISYLSALRRDQHGAACVSTAEIREWCAKRTAVPKEDDEPFVLKYHVLADSLDPDTQELRIMLSTRRLLGIASKSDLVQSDATYKITWQGFPLLVVGTTDKQKMFHPFALALSNAERKDDFAFMFRSLRTFNDQWEPSILLADGSEAITAGFVDAFGVPRVRLQCYYHVLHNLEKFLKPIPEKKRVSIKRDISALQTVRDPTTFTVASALFVKKWKEEHPKFVYYFHAQWLKKNNNWYEGAAPGHPNLNNGLEGTNAWIKTGHTFRKRLPVGQFLNHSTELLSKWSMDRNPDCINCLPFAEELKIPLKLWTAAYHWALEQRKVLQRSFKCGSTHFYTTSSSFRQPITTTILKDYQSSLHKWKSFDDFTRTYYGVWMITMNADRTISSCTCPYFAKNQECKHALGIKIREKAVVVPPEARNVRLGQKRKRGRPSKARRALLI